MAKQKQKNVYFFGNGKAEGKAEMKDILGGKGANLAEMTNLGIPVPPGFTISTAVCAAFYDNGKQYPEGLEDEVLSMLGKLEKLMGKKLGDSDDPLLVSVRSGAPVSMPGMMDTILNLGMNDESVYGLAKKTGNVRFAWDAYRRFIQMYGNVVMTVPHDEFEKAITDLKAERNIQLDTELTEDDLEALVGIYKKLIKKTVKKEFPQDPLEQLWGAINAVFSSWMNERAITYRRLEGITNVKGTAVNIQSMVFGNFGEDSGTGVCFSRDPSTGKKEFYGEYLMNAQGEDVVAGIRTPEKMSTLSKKNPVIYEELVAIKDKLEDHFKDMQDMEFTIQQGKLFILQTRNAKRTGAAAVKCVVDMVEEGVIDKNQAILRITSTHLDQLLHHQISSDALKKAVSLTKGLNASPGAACGRIVFSAQDAEAWHTRGEKVLLVRKDTSPEDIGGMVVSQGILTSTGGMTSHAAIVACGMGRPCVSGAKGVMVEGKEVVIGDKTFYEGDWLTIDGSTGDVYEGQLSLIVPNISKDMSTFLQWCDDVRAASKRGDIKGFEVRTNADQPDDAKRAFGFGAQGIGLCRTEHMFFEKDKLIHFRAMIMANSVEERKQQLKKILPFQRKDFYGIFKVMEGRPVTIRLLDPPLHEFVPHTREEIEELAAHLGVEADSLVPRIEKLHESNSMLGHRGCRLAITYPEIYDMQVEAIALAAADCVKKNIPVDPEIMIPIVVSHREIAMLRSNAEAVLKRVFEKAGVDIHVKIGTMIEVPRAAISAKKVARDADFFSFGTNDLTQMTFAFSRDDAASFMPVYLDKQVLDVDPFKSIDEDGVGGLMRYAINEGRSTNPDLKLGICGEHGGDPQTIDFCFRIGLNYVSCSPFRVPLARIAAAQAVIRNSGKDESASTGKKRGRKAGADASKDAPEQVSRQGRKPKQTTETESTGKRGRKPKQFAEAERSSGTGKRGRKPKQAAETDWVSDVNQDYPENTPLEFKTAGKRGRPRKTPEQEAGMQEDKPKAKRGRKPKNPQTVVDEEE
jgi:pyruvate,orthophosphate dikinase